MSYAITTIWHERNRFLPAIMAVAFSALLIALQSGLLMIAAGLGGLKIVQVN